jgi:CheY-like chemotaxis protein
VKDSAGALTPEKINQLYAEPSPADSGRSPHPHTARKFGLRVTLNTIKRMGGIVVVEREHNNYGSVTFYLPVAEERMPFKVATVKQSDSRTNNETILVVESNSSMRSLIIELLELHGFKAKGAKHGGLALELLAQDQIKPDLLLARIDAPYVTGIELARRISEQGLPTKVLLMSDSMRNQQQESEVENLDLSLLIKPFSPQELLHAVAQVLEIKPRMRVRATH